MRISSFLLITLLIFSCTEEMEMTTWPVRDILVVNSFITPDSLFSCHVSRVKAVTDKNDYWVENATVTIFNDASGELMATLTHQGSGYYKAESERPTLQTPYRLEVIAPGFPTATGVTNIPLAATPDSVMVQYEAGDEWQGTIGTYDELRFSITDIDPARNYFEIAMGGYSWRTHDGLVNDTTWPSLPWTELEDSIFIFYDILGQYVYEFTINDPVLVNEDLPYREGPLLFTDELFQGGTHRFTYRASIGCGNGYYFFTLLTLSRELYLYRRTLYQHKYEQGVKEPRHIPDLATFDFKGNPVDVYSNISGGYGIFAGYSHRIKYSPFFQHHIIIYEEDEVWGGRIHVDDHFNYLLYFNLDSIQIVP